MTAMDVFFQVACLLLLVIIVVQLQLLRTKPTQSSRQSFSEDERAGRQTINVNVGLGGVSTDTTGLANVHKEQEPDSVKDSIDSTEAIKLEEPVRAPHVPAAPRPNSRSTVSGIAAVKCSSCGAENSSYRRECFQCGKAI